MAQSSFPFQAVDTTETQFSQWARHIITNGRSGVNGIPTGSDLKVTANSSGMQVFVAAGQAMVRGHFYISTAAETLAIGAANTNPRIDSVVLKLDPAINTIVLQVVAGTAAASPVPPTLTQTDAAIYQFKIADVRVEPSTTTIDAGKVTDTREFMRDIWTTATRPVAAAGIVGFNTTTSKVEFYDGGQWLDIASAIDASKITSGTLETARIPNLDAAKITSGTLADTVLPTIPVAKGGTGLTAPTTGSYIKGAGAAGLAPQTGVPGADITGSVAVANGGTGATTEAQARTNLGVAPVVHSHTASQITDPVNITAGKIYAGGTTGGAATRIFVQSTTPSGASTGDLWFW